MNFNWSNLSGNSSETAQNANDETDRYDADFNHLDADIEVAGAIDAFVSLEDVVPDADWAEVLAAAWGMPYPSSAEIPDR
ncbi:MAG: hypothetical protein KME13_22565 [Myxacorys californica WJT36-NPBG1]|jgi:hypothetical protein|nr:hypothetical protein [Myxacorys californica WJT36-NPBG1]